MSEGAKLTGDIDLSMKSPNLNQISFLKGIEGFTVVNKKTSYNFDTVNLLLLDEKYHPGTWEAHTLESSRIMSQSFF